MRPLQFIGVLFALVGVVRGKRPKRNLVVLKVKGQQQMPLPLLQQGAPKPWPLLPSQTPRVTDTLINASCLLMLQTKMVVHC